MTEYCGVGIDIAKATLDVALSTDPGQPWQTTNDEAGWAAVVAHVEPLQPRVIVLEATGGYETARRSALTAAGLPVAIVNPRQVRDFANALGPLEKTDASMQRSSPPLPRAFSPRLGRSPMICRPICTRSSPADGSWWRC